MISPIKEPTVADPASVATRIPQKALGQQDFLKLITVQLTKQDPMKPMEDTSFIAQMAQFTSLEQTNTLVKEFGLMRSSANFSSASALLGRQVTLHTKADGNVTGSVDAVDASDGTPRLSVGGKLFPLSTLTRVEPAPLPAA